jgi:O-antigen biosynthesis protein
MSKKWKQAQLFSKIRMRLAPPNSWMERAGRMFLSIVTEINFWGNLFLIQKYHLLANTRKRPVIVRLPADNNKPKLQLLQQEYSKKNILKPKIGYVIPGTAISGGVAVVCEHVNRLVLRGYDVSIISEDNQNKIPWFPNQLAPVFPLRQIAGDVYNIIVATGWTTAYTARQLTADRKFYFVQSDESRFYIPRSFKSKIASKTYEMGFEFITMARWLQNWLKEEFGKNSIYVPNGINEQIIFSDTPIENKENKIRVLLEGPINIPFKGMRDAFLAVDSLDCEVWCVSSLGRPEPEWRCDKFFEKVPFDKMRRIYSSCDILLKMSRVESFCYPPLEMMACGGTAVVGKVTGIDEYIVDGYNALVVEQGDIQGAHNAIKKLIEDEELRNRLSINGKKTAELLRWDPSIDILEDIFFKGSV